MSLSIFEAALTDASQDLLLRHNDGRTQLLDVVRWSGPPDAADRALLRRLGGPVLDVGCGPGRLGAALTARGIDALGLDVSATAVQLARQRGGHAVQADVFGAVPRAGQWGDVLLVDGNVGIGGSPSALLARCASLLADGGSLHVEVDPPGGQSGSGRVRLERTGRPGSWFSWGWLPDSDVEAVVAPLSLHVVDRWQRGTRRFVQLSAGQPTPVGLHDVSSR